jgi:hypothetical protein
MTLFLEKEEATRFAVAGGMGHKLLSHTSAPGRLEPVENYGSIGLAKHGQTSWSTRSD